MVNHGKAEAVRTISLVIIAGAAMIMMLYLGADFFVPIVFAVLLTIVFRPIVRALERIHVPDVAGAGIIVLAILGACVLIGVALTQPIQDWFESAPQRFAAAEMKLQHLRSSIEAATSVVMKLENATRGNAATVPTTAAVNSPQPPPPVRALGLAGAPAIFASVLGTTTKLLGATVEIVLMLYLFLSVGDLFLKKIIKEVSQSRDKNTATRIVDESATAVMRYVVVLSLINVAQGIIISVAMWLLGMPSPLLWGVFAFVLEFIPYLGAMIMISLLTVIAFATFDSLAHTVLVPAVYLVMTTLNNSIVGPMTYGRNLKLNPVAVLIGVLFWAFVWGVPGAFLAVPIVATIKVVCDRVPSLEALGEFLGE